MPFDEIFRIQGRFVDGDGRTESALKLIGDENSSIVGIARMDARFCPVQRTAAIGSLPLEGWLNETISPHLVPRGQLSRPPIAPETTTRDPARMFAREKGKLLYGFIG